eukprot:TRINITY_DN3142_c3_g1_i2.p1 TRINITY_DN3142_c3_g1~~TRINITY_DN3142_c3_g1_i2.p1  ORF type:complete len:160 (+),score=37.18 TRINITY_DN3142_c3_g1_i2:196-675(+)
MTDMEYEIREEEMLDVDEEDQPQRQRRLKSTVVSTRVYEEDDDVMAVEDESRERDHGIGGGGPAKSIEGWVIFINNVHGEATEEVIYETFGEYGDIKNIYLNLDRRTGFAKGYVIVEYEKKSEAENAINSMNGQEFMTQEVAVTWCFGKGAIKTAHKIG